MPYGIKDSTNGIITMDVKINRVQTTRYDITRRKLLEESIASCLRGCLSLRNVITLELGVLLSVLSSFS